MPNSPLIRVTDRGLFCEAGEFHIDPWKGVERAVITHAHADHARPGSEKYLCSTPGVEPLRLRVQQGARIEGLAYGEATTINGVRVSLHPAGHLLGSAQVRVEYQGEVWVVSGDYKLERDGTCEPFDVVPCNVFITESTFGLPIYRWRPEAEVMAEINAWWRGNQEKGRTSVLLAYSLGKAQRLLHGVDASIGPIVAHGAVRRFVEVYQAAGVAMPETLGTDKETRKLVKGRGLVVGPPSTYGSPWLRGFAPTSIAFASGWMMSRGARRWRAADRGFVVSDHVDWPGLLATIKATGAEHIGVTHGYVKQVVRYLREQGKSAEVVPTHFEGEMEGTEEAEEESAADERG